MTKELVKHVKLFFAFSLSVWMASCSPSKRISTYDYMYIQNKSITAKPLVAEIDVKQTKIHEEKVYKKVPVASVKALAMVDFMKDNNCDVVIGPMYSIIAKKGKFTVDLSGYAGTYKNIHTYEPRDSANFKLFRVTTLVDAEAASNRPKELLPQKKSAHGKTFFKVLFGIIIPPLGIVLLAVNKHHRLKREKLAAAGK